ncbi:RHTO0S04e06722g1_1 [Rhodotorula toruloides]|uniref:RHTO0S04e06722g1_1 n=1 Tax=Rhodotorula toruloides TaxID=5286 RepID=A0A061APP5_RHOTO|nr:RHTO0S04e06722g1_1 [Rhodotorula toruloides]
MRIDGGARSGWDGGRQCFKSGLSSPSSLSLLHLTRSFPQPPPLSSPRQPPPPTPPYSSSALLFSLELPRPAPSPSDSSSSASLPRQRRPRRPASRTWASTAAEVSSGRAGWTLSSRRSGGRVDLSTTFAFATPTPLRCYGTAKLLHLRRRPLTLSASRWPGRSSLRVAAMRSATTCR